MKQNDNTANTHTFIRVAMASALLAMTSGAVAGKNDVPSLKAGVAVPPRNIFAMTSDSSIYLLSSRGSQYQRLGRIDPDDGGNLIGIDFRPADKSQTRFYGLTDLGNLFLIDATRIRNGVLVSTRISSMNPRFIGGLESVMDFNPVANALRVTGSSDQNLAVVNGPNGENLSTTVVQTNFAYVQGDVNFGQDPEITGGAYTNNAPGAQSTIFFMIDHNKDTLVTIADRTATGSSNTSSGRLQTVGRIVYPDGKPFNLSPTTDFDIYTDGAGRNFLVGQTTRWLFSIDLEQIDPNLPVGRTQTIVARAGTNGPPPTNGALSGGVFDIAVPSL